MHISDITAPVAADFSSVDQEIHKQLTSNVPLVEKIAEYIIDSGGKRMRPLLVLLTAKACGYMEDRHVELATIIEFIHTATLLHDDVVDASGMRRGKPTSNAKWGNAPSVLVGDFLYSRAFEMMVDIGNLDIMAILSKATNVIAEGEVLQLTNVGNPDVTEENYLQVIKGKTAMLFEACSHTAASLAGQDKTVCQAMSKFGLDLGLAFQMIDDVLDYEGDSEALGKNVGDDLAEGKPTLPLIQAMKVANDEDRKLIRKAIRKGGSEDMDRILQIIHDTGALKYTKDMALGYRDSALEALDTLPASEFKTALVGLVNLALNRSS